MMLLRVLTEHPREEQIEKKRSISGNQLLMAQMSTVNAPISVSISSDSSFHCQLQHGEGCNGEQGQGSFKDRDWLAFNLQFSDISLQNAKVTGLGLHAP
ncbi:hypothetical protein STEG23_028538, partial [Scotinomys teguina]